MSQLIGAMECRAPPHACTRGMLFYAATRDALASVMVSLRTKFWFTHDNRDRRNAGTSFRTKGSIPMLQASANRTAQMLTARSPALESRSLIWVNFAVKSVRAAISSRISGKSTRGSRAAISLRSRTRLSGSSSLSGEVRTSSSLPSAFSTRANGFDERLVATC